MKAYIYSVVAVASLFWINTSNAQLEVPPQEVTGPEFDTVDQNVPRPAKAGNAFYVSCAFMVNAPDGMSQPIVPLMFVVNTKENRQVPPDDQPMTRSFTQTFDVIQDPRGLFDQKGSVTVIDRRPVYIMLEWKDPRSKDVTVLLPYAGVVSGPHRVAGLLGVGHLQPSFDAKDWKVIPGGILEHTMRAKCNVYETTRGSVVMGASK